MATLDGKTGGPRRFNGPIGKKKSIFHIFDKKYICIALCYMEINFGTETSAASKDVNNNSAARLKV